MLTLIGFAIICVIGYFTVKYINSSIKSIPIQLRFGAAFSLIAYLIFAAYR